MQTADEVRASHAAWRISSLNSITGDFTLPQEEAPIAPQNTPANTTMLSRTLRAAPRRMPAFRSAYSTTTDNPVPANDPNARQPRSPVSATNAMPTSAEGSQREALQESPEQGEELRVSQAPNRKGIWSRSQQPREKAMVGPRFEQTIMADQVCLGRGKRQEDRIGKHWGSMED